MAGDPGCVFFRNFWAVSSVLTHESLFGPFAAASGRPMVLTVEGNPTDALVTRGGYGNAKRVGHDISPEWLSMVSLGKKWQHAMN